MSKVRSVRDGVDANARRVVAGATAATAAPAATENGYSLQGAKWLHVYARLNSGATAVAVTPWYWSSIAGAWFEGVQISLSAATVLFATVETRGEERVFIQVDSVTGGGNVDVWAGYSHDEPGREP